MSVSLLSDDDLEGMEAIADDLADTVAKALYAEREVVPFIKGLRDVGKPAYDPPPQVKAYLTDHRALPEWADLEKIRRAEELFAGHQLLVVTALFCASLPECYAIDREAKVLYRSRALADQTLRRVRQTGEFILNVMAPGGLSAQAPRGDAGWEDGRVHALVVRLLHAVMRRLMDAGLPPEITSPSLTEGGERPDIRDPAVQWLFAFAPPDTEAGGMPGVRASAEAIGDEDYTPLNQLQLAFTLLTFHYVIIRGLEAAGVRWKPRDREAYIHAWNVAGHFVGVRHDLMAWTYEEARDLFERIKRLRGGVTEPGKQLTARLLEALQAVVPRDFLDGAPLATMHLMLGPETAGQLGLDAPSRWDRLVARVYLRGVRVLGYVVDTGNLAKTLVRLLRARSTRAYSVALADLSGDRAGLLARVFFRQPKPLSEANVGAEAGADERGEAPT